MSGTGRTQLFLIARFCFHRLSLPRRGILWGLVSFFVLLFFPAFCFEVAGGRGGARGAITGQAIAMECSPAYSSASKGHPPGWMTTALSYPRFGVNSWVFSNSTKSIFSVDSAGESRALRQHKPLRTKLKNTFPKPPACLKTQHVGRSVITISSHETCFGNLSFTAQEAKCCPYAMDESMS